MPFFYPNNTQHNTSPLNSRLHGTHKLLTGRGCESKSGVDVRHTACSYDFAWQTWSHACLLSLYFPIQANERRCICEKEKEDSQRTKMERGQSE